MDQFRWHISIPQRRSWKCIRRPSTLLVRLPRNWRFTFPFCSCNQERHSFCATWQCQTRARLGKKEAYQLPLKSEKKLSVEGTDYIHITACTMHSMFRALFGVPHLFARELLTCLMNSPHCKAFHAPQWRDLFRLVIIQTWISADKLSNEQLGFLQRPLDTYLNRVNTIIWHK